MPKEIMLKEVVPETSELAQSFRAVLEGTKLMQAHAPTAGTPRNVSHGTSKRETPLVGGSALSGSSTNNFGSIASSTLRGRGQSEGDANGDDTGEGSSDANAEDEAEGDDEGGGGSGLSEAFGSLTGKDSEDDEDEDSNDDGEKKDGDGDADSGEGKKDGEDLEGTGGSTGDDKGRGGEAGNADVQGPADGGAEIEVPTIDVFKTESDGTEGGGTADSPSDSGSPPPEGGFYRRDFAPPQAQNLFAPHAVTNEEDRVSIVPSPGDAQTHAPGESNTSVPGPPGYPLSSTIAKRPPQADAPSVVGLLGYPSPPADAVSRNALASLPPPSPESVDKFLGARGIKV